MANPDQPAKTEIIKCRVPLDLKEAIYSMSCADGHGGQESSWIRTLVSNQILLRQHYVRKDLTLEMLAQYTGIDTLTLYKTIQEAK